MKGPARAAAVAALCVVAVALGYWVGTLSDSNQAPRPNNATETRLIPISLEGVDGRTHTHEEWRDKFVLLNFWASWCPPCLTEIPLLIEHQQTFGDLGLQVVGIGIDEADALRRFGDSLGLNYPSLVAGRDGMNLMSTYGNTSGNLPFTVLFDRDGNLVARKVGELTRADLSNWLKHLMPPQGTQS